MCGIAGKLNLDGRPVERALLRRMAGRLVHRGPDDDGFHVAGAIGLASRRLSIIDVDTGRQPVSNEDGTVHVVLNGEIYNFVELRGRLEAAGHRFRTRTDTEVLVHLWEDHGVGLLDHVRGMFALALWDARRRELLLARDRLGEKPLFYALVPGRTLVFGSELKAVLADPEVETTLDPVALDQYLSLLYVPAPRTIHREVRKLPAAHYLRAAGGAIEVREYWDVPLPPANAPAPVDAEALRERLDEAVRLQLRSDVPLGAFLSGGVDSSTVVASMAAHLGPGVVTCSVGFAQARYSEVGFARQVAAAVRSDHQERAVEAPGPALIERLGWHLDEPFGDSSAVPTFAVSATARERVKVALSGDGGDELFGGYRRHAVERWEQRLRRCGGPLARVLGGLARALPAGVRGRNALGRLAEAPERACAAKFAHDSRADGARATLYGGELRALVADADPLEPFRRFYARAAATDPLNRILYVDLKTYLADDILVKVDRMSMAHGLEVRAPLLDHRLVELVAGWPGPAKVSAAATKPLLRALLEGVVPRQAWDRPKHGFEAPIGEWLRAEPLRGYAEDLLLAPSGLCARLLDRRALRALWQAHLSGQADHRHELWMLLMLETWHRRHARRAQESAR
jgi:asparagine synthase (glutamine-hydrolysing)